MCQVGLVLQPDDEYLDLVEPLAYELVDYYEVAPETLWWLPPEAEASFALRPNGFHRRFLRLGSATGKPFVAHGVGLSLGGVGDGARRRAWLERIRADQALFGFLWYTDHLGVSAPGGAALTLPLPLWMDRASGERVARRLRALAEVVPAVGVENTAQYFLLGDALEEPRFLRRLLERAGGHLLLDLHNLHTMAENLGFSPRDYLERLDLDQVIEIHVSGGSTSDPAWLPEGRALRLDSHDGAVPEPVWRLLEEVAPRCRRLRGVTLERMEGTVTPREVPLLREELRRIRRTLAGARASASTGVSTGAATGASTGAGP